MEKGANSWSLAPTCVLYQSCVCIHAIKCNTRLKKMVGKEQTLLLMCKLEESLNVGRLAGSFCCNLCQRCVRMVGDSDSGEETGCRRHYGRTINVRAEFNVIPDWETN